jgi:transcriptional regulator with XRE-family HTH domain
MGSLKDRLREVIYNKRLSQVEFAKLVNLSTPSVSRLLNSDSDPTLPTLQNICEKLDVNLNWLATGKGQMFEVDNNVGKSNGNSSHGGLSTQEMVAKIQSLEEENRRLKEINQEKGYSNVNLSGDEQVLCFVDSNSISHYPYKLRNEEYLLQLSSIALPFSRFGKGSYRAFEIPGDAMSKKVNRGDWVICQRVENIAGVKDNFVYVIVLEDEVVCRRVINRIESRKRLRLKSDNISFGDFEVEIEQIKEVWEVKSVMTFDLRNPDFQVYSWIKKLEDDIAELNIKQVEMEKKLKESIVKG